MKNNLNYIIFFLGLTFFKATAQNPEIKTDLPTVIPPSPTVAALMKFEEVPVSNYTGVPDISIPLFSTPTLSKDINFNLALSYHSGSIRPETVSSDTGLGWSLLAGGTISRTVRGLPDEIYSIRSGANGGHKIGVYQNNTYYKNIYHKMFGFQVLGVSLPFTFYEMNEYLFDIVEKNKMDTQYDLWQFNFMGKTGRFIIEKNFGNNTLFVKNLSLANDIQIKLNYDPQTFVVNTIEIFDNLGYRYLFDIIEKSKNTTINTSTSFVPASSPISNISEDDEFASAYNLSKIFSPNNKLLIDFIYTSQQNIEFTISHTEENYVPENLTESIFMTDYIHTQETNCSGSLNSLAPKSVVTTQQTKVFTKKISTIKVIDFAIIEFNYQLGRLDSKLISAQNSLILKEFVIKNWQDIFIKKVSLNHVYRTSKYNRLFLESIQTKDQTQLKTEDYKFEYKDLPLSYNNEIFKNDVFGYLTIVPSYLSNFYYNEVNPDYTATDVLQKIVYPSGGSAIFDFQSNTYSFEGDEAITNYNDNIKNWDVFDQTVSFNNLSNVYKPFFTLTESQDINLVSTLNVNSSDFRFIIYKYENNVYTSVGGIDESTCADGNCSAILYNLSPGAYFVTFTSVDLNFPTTFNATIKAIYKVNNNTYQYDFGGGVRIDKIAYFKDNVAKNVFDSPLTATPAKLINYNYHQNNISNGALVTKKPIFQYDYKLQKVHDVSPCLPGCYNSLTPIFNLKKLTSYNNIKTIQTQGADIGYSSVKVIEIGKGYTSYEYTSPRDYPETRNNFYPFLISENLDFKRGLLKNEKVYDSSNKIINDNTYSYTIEEASETDKVYGLYFYVLSFNSTNLFYNPYAPYAINYDVYYNLGVLCSTCPFNFGSCSGFIQPNEYVNIELLKESFGWAKLTSKTTKNYFYEGNTQKIVQTDETYAYNPINKKISESTISNSFGEVMKTKYFYLPTVDTPTSKNNISTIEKIETYRDNALLSSSKINYSTAFAGNVSYLPQTITTSKGNNALEARVRYNAYDEFSKPLEVQQENGTIISYIYGYNQTLPVAKLENMAYGSIPANLITAIQSATNTGTEASVITALNSLRTNENLANAMITTFTYKPLVGVSTITDPKGDTITYEYDSFGRLSTVKDKNGNILSENQYNYRTQN
jgi:YD repeat-containing protein